MEAIDVANFPDDFGGNNNSATRSSLKRLPVIFHKRGEFFFNLLNLLSQIKDAAHGSFHSLLQYDVCVLGDASHPISQGFLGEWVFELCAVAGVVYSAKEDVELILEPRPLFDQPFPLKRYLPYLLGFLGFVC